MPRYLYIAKTRDGVSKKGVLDIKDEHELARVLYSEGYILIKSELKEKKSKIKILQIPFLEKVSLIEKTMFTRNLKVMISSGIPLPRALNILSQQTKSKKFKKVILEIREGLLKGSSFSESLAGHPNIFPEVFVNMVKVGEESGTLENVLEVLTNQMEKTYKIKSKVRSAMIYPAVILIAMIGIGTVMLILVVPKLSKLFDDLGMDLPLTTRMVVTVGNFLSRFWYTIPVFIIIVVVLLRAILRNKRGKAIFDSFVLAIPIISPIVKKTYSAITLRTLSSLVSAGIPLVRSLEIVSGALGNTHYKNAMKDAAEKIKKGNKLSEILQKYDNIYPILVRQMIAVGEETGETSSILGKLADFFEEEVDTATGNLSAVVEPFLMLIIGIAVGFFAISMIQPMYSMMGEL